MSWTANPIGHARMPRALVFVIGTMVLLTQAQSVFGDCTTPSVAIQMGGTELVQQQRAAEAKVRQCSGCLKQTWTKRRFIRQRTGQCQWCSDNTCSDNCEPGNPALHKLGDQTPENACQLHQKCKAHQTCKACAADSNCMFCAQDSTPKCVVDPTKIGLTLADGECESTTGSPAQSALECPAKVCSAPAMDSCAKCTRKPAFLDTGCVYCIDGVKDLPSHHCTHNSDNCVGTGAAAVSSTDSKATHKFCRTTPDECCICDGSRRAPLSKGASHGHLMCEVPRLDETAKSNNRAYEGQSCAARCDMMSLLLGGQKSSQLQRGAVRQPFAWVSRAQPVHDITKYGTKEACGKPGGGHYVNCNDIETFVKELYDPTKTDSEDPLRRYDLTRSDLNGAIRGLEVEDNDELATLDNIKVVAGSMEVNVAQQGTRLPRKVLRKTQLHQTLDDKRAAGGWLPVSAYVHIAKGSGVSTTVPVMIKTLETIDMLALPLTALFYGFSYAHKEHPWGSDIVPKLSSSSTTSEDTSSLLFWTEIGSPLASGKTPFSFGNFVTADGYFQFLATMRMIVFAVEKLHTAGYVHGRLCPQNILLKDPSSQSSITRDQLPEVFNNAVNLNRGRVEPRLYGLQSAGKFADGDYLRGLVDSSCIKPLMGMKLSELNEPSAWEYDACMKDTAPMMTAYLPADFVGAQFKLLQEPFQHLFDVKADSTQGEGDGAIVLEAATAMIGDVMQCLDVYALGLTLLEAFGFYSMGERGEGGYGAGGRLSEMLRKSPSEFASNVKVAVFEDQKDTGNAPSATQKAAAVCSGLITAAMPANTLGMQAAPFLSKIADKLVAASSIPARKQQHIRNKLKVLPETDTTAVKYWDRITEGCDSGSKSCMLPERSFGTLYKLGSAISNTCADSLDDCPTVTAERATIAAQISCTFNRDLLAQIVSPSMMGTCSPQKLFPRGASGLLGELAFKTPDLFGVSGNNGDNDDDNDDDNDNTGDISSQLATRLSRGRTRGRLMAQRSQQMLLPPVTTTICTNKFRQAVTAFGRTPTSSEKKTLCEKVTGCTFVVDESACQAA